MRELSLEDFEGEEWRGVTGYEDALQVSNYGRIKRLASNVLKWNKSKLGKPFLHNTKVEEKILKQQIDRCGYSNIRTQIKGIRFSSKVHRLVMTAFVPNNENKRCINHKDGVKSNNMLSNLEWVTDSENILHAIKNGLLKVKTGENAHRFSGAVDAYNKDTNEFVCRMFGNLDMKDKGFDFRLISAVLKGKRKSHNGCYFIKIEVGELYYE